MGSIGITTPLGMAALSTIRKSNASQATGLQNLVPRSPRHFPRLRLRYPSVHKSDTDQETVALKEQEALLTIYHELASSGKMILYTGNWVKKPIPFTKLEWAELEGKRTVVAEWTKIDYVTLPSDVEGFTSIVLTGLYNYFWAKYVDSMAVHTMIQAVESGEISFEEGTIEFPISSRQIFAPVRNVNKARKRLRDWLEVHGLPRCDGSDLICYNTALKLVSRVQDQYKTLTDELMDMWPEHAPFFGGIEVNAEGDNDNEAEPIEYLDEMTC
jgi:hypothetical protein